MYGNLLRRLSDGDRADSLLNRLRNRRFMLFERLVSELPRPIRILDIGGTVSFWAQRGWAGRDDVQITLVNLTVEPSPYVNVLSLKGDATQLSEFSDQSIDVVFSNSVIEHLFDQERQAAMAREVMRVGRDYWVQTPNRRFPMEPHFQVPGWQWLPRDLRVAMLMRRRCGRRGPCAKREDAERLVDEVRLLSQSELAELFPGANITAERFAGLVKSWIVHTDFRP
jgi:hypothetical protein